MRRTCWTAILTGALLLVGDVALAVPLPSCVPAGPTVPRLSAAPEAEVLVARRRKKKKKKRPRRPPKPAPDPAPAPAPAPDPAVEAAEGPAVSGGGLARTNRIDFDAQLIKGQTTKAGEVQILERKDTELKSMVRRRTSFRPEIIHTVFPEKEKK